MEELRCQIRADEVSEKQQKEEAHPDNSEVRRSKGGSSIITARGQDVPRETGTTGGLTDSSWSRGGHMPPLEKLPETEREGDEHRGFFLFSMVHWPLAERAKMEHGSHTEIVTTDSRWGWETSRRG